jgi:hypothetical protein
MKIAGFPEIIKKGNSSVTIYGNRFDGYEQYKLAYYADGRRKLETFGDYQDAKDRADEINKDVNGGNVDVLTLTGADKLSFSRAIEALKPSGIPLELAAMQFADAVGILGGVSIIEAARFYRKRHPATLPNFTVTQAVDEFVKVKTEAGIRIHDSKKTGNNGR